MRMEKIAGIFVIVFVIGILTSYSSAAEKLNLKLRLKPGQKYGMRLITELKRLETVEGSQEHESFMFARGMEFEVKEVDANDVASVEVTYRTLQMKVIRAGGDSVEYDSTKQSMADDYRKIPVILAAGVGESFIMKVTSKGKIIRLTGIEKMRERIVEKINAWDEKYLKIKIEGWKEMRRHNTKSRYSEKRIKNMLSDMIVAFPDRPLAIGDSWTDKLKIWGESQIDGTYTLKDAEKGAVTLYLRAKRTPEEKPFSWVNNEGRKVGFKIVGFCQGTFQIDKASGWLIRSKVNMRFTGQVIEKPGDKQKREPILQEEVITVEPMEVE